MTIAPVFVSVLTIAVGALLASNACAQAPTPEGAIPAKAPTEAPQVADEIVVRGQRMSDIESGLRIEVQKFVAHVAAPAPERGYARWHNSVCVSVDNLDRDAAQYLVDRISRAAADVGLAPGEPGCTPEVVVIFTNDGKQTAAAIVEKQQGVLRPTPEGGLNQGLDAMREFAQSDKPVRWWSVSVPVDARMGNPAMRMPSEELSPPLDQLHWVTVEGSSRVHSGTRDDMKYVIIIVDAPKLQGRGTTWQQLGDYLALVSLAQIDAKADVAAFDSILNLFSNPLAYSGLTDWDRSYIRALYTYDQERVVSTQQNELVGQMVRRQVHNRE